MGITIACFALLLKFLIPPIISKESIVVVLSMILMLNVEFFILMKSYELDILYESHISKLRNDSKYENNTVALSGFRGTKTTMSVEEINDEIQKHRMNRNVAISPGVDDEQFNLHMTMQPLYNDEPTITEPLLQEEPDIPPEITIHDITDDKPRSMKDIIEEAEKQLMKTIADKPVEHIEVYSEPIQAPVVYGDQPIATEAPIIEKPKAKSGTKRKAILRKKR